MKNNIVKNFREEMNNGNAKIHAEGIIIDELSMCKNCTKSFANSMTVNTAISNTKKFLSEYFSNTLAQRLAGGAGSCYDQFDSAENLEIALRRANWEETTHKDVMEGCKVFKTNLPGRFGLVKIAELSDSVKIIADDRKGTGCISLTVSGTKGNIVEETYLIIGEEKGEDVVFTFHPGEPIRPSNVSTSEIAHGDIVSKSKAKELGFDFAKIV